MAFFLISLSLIAILVSGNYTNSVIHGDFPDPGVFFDPQTRLFYAASTSGDAADHFPIHSSPNAVDWSPVGYIFPANATPAWTQSDYWAPEIHLVNDQYVAVFVARNKKGKLSVGLAVSNSSVLGPYTDLGHELITASNMGYIDPHIFVDTDTTPYIIFKADANDPAN